MFSRTLALLVLPAFAAMAQDAAPDAAPQPVAPASASANAPSESANNVSPITLPQAILKDVLEIAPGEKTYPVTAGTKVLLSMVNTISTKNAQPGDTIYLQTSFPVFVNNRMVIPVGSYVMGTVTASKRPGKVKGRGEIFVRFDSLTFPNGVVRDFHAGLSNVDGKTAGTLNRAESSVKGDGNVVEDIKTAGIGGAAGAAVGGLATGRGMGAAGGGLAGAAVGTAIVLFTRGPDLELTKGSSVEMILDRQLLYSESELDFSRSGPSSGAQTRSDNRPVLGRP